MRGIAGSLDEVAAIAQRFTRGRTYIVQRGVDVLTHQGNNVDLRALVQRDGGGEWRITSMPVRIAVDECPVTSTSSGSTVYQFEDALGRVIGLAEDQVHDIRENACALIYSVVEVIEKEYGVFGELGIDIAIDRGLKLWFLEANAKPGKDTILIAGPPEDITEAYVLPFEYSKYLAGFRCTRNVEGWPPFKPCGRSRRNGGVEEE